MKNQEVPFRELCFREKKTIIKRKLRTGLLEKIVAPSKLFHVSFNDYGKDFRFRDQSCWYCQSFTDPFNGEEEMARVYDGPGFRIYYSDHLKPIENWSLPKGETDYLVQSQKVAAETFNAFFEIERIVKNYDLNTVALENEAVLNDYSLQIRICLAKAWGFRTTFYTQSKAWSRRNVDNIENVRTANQKLKPTYELLKQISESIVELRRALEEYEEALLSARTKNCLAQSKLTVLTQIPGKHFLNLRSTTNTIKKVLASID